ncbi:MAG: two-component system sensor histidine kinase NtrB [Syntrophaceticus sp.]|jgi:signal transduction histidine kinase
MGRIKDAPIFYQAFEALPLGIAVFDRTGKVAFMNSNLAKVMGLDPNQVCEENIKRLLQEKGVPAEHPLFRIFAGEEYTGTAAPLTDFYPSYVSTKILKGDDGENAGGVLLLWDATDRQELEQAVLKSERLAIIGQIAAIALHEVRNPLSAIKGYLQLLKKELEDARQLEYVKVMLRSLDRLNTLITDYLRLAKPGTPERRPCDMEELLSDILSLYKSEVKSKGIRFSFSCDPDLPPVSLDRDQFYQVVVNVLKNAIEVTPLNGEVYVGIKHLKEKDMVAFFVRDTGPGVPKDVLSRIFDPFFTTRDEGTGLGLYVCREIVNNHGGGIDVANNPGEGCTVTITFPCIKYI